MRMPALPSWAQNGEMTNTPIGVCRYGAGRPRVVVAITHRVMRELIVELLRRDQDCWNVSAVARVSEIGHDGGSPPDLVIVDTADFGACCCELPPSVALAQVVVIGPEPDPAYRHAALHRGAAAWLSRECAAEELCDALRSALAGAPSQITSSSLRGAEDHSGIAANEIGVFPDVQ